MGFRIEDLPGTWGTRSRSGHDPVKLEEALRFPARVGFLSEDRFSFDFSGTVLHRYRLSPDFPASPENIFH